MTITLDTFLTFLLILSASIWIGGVVTVIIVTLVSKRTLDESARVEFSRAFGSTYLSVAGPALVVTALLGWSFLLRLEWSSELARMAFASTMLVLVLLAGIFQARSLTRMRRELIARPDDAELQKKVANTGRAATVLRTLIVVFTLGLTFHSSAMITSLL